MKALSDYDETLAVYRSWSNCASVFSVFICLFFLSLGLLRNYELYVHHYRLPALMDISIW